MSRLGERNELDKAFAPFPCSRGQSLAFRIDLSFKGFWRLGIGCTSRSRKLVFYVNNVIRVAMITALVMQTLMSKRSSKRKSWRRWLPYAGQHD
jgi:hypothetical protein